MGRVTGISWCDHTFNGWVGCTKHGPGCLHCYAEAQDHRWGHDSWGPGKPRRETVSPWRDVHHWDAAARKAKQSSRVFAMSLADWADHEAPPGLRAHMWQMIRNCPWLDFLLLTKRTERIADCLPQDWGNGYPNVWLGATVVTRNEVHRMVPQLLAVPARLHWLSLEPQLEDLADDVMPHLEGHRRMATGQPGVRWLVTGGESASLDVARNYDPQWATNLLNVAHGEGRTDVFVKQMGTAWARSKLMKVCRVYHGDPCDICGGRGFHTDRCPEANPAMVCANCDNPMPADSKRNYCDQCTDADARDRAGDEAYDREVEG